MRASIGRIAEAWSSPAVLFLGVVVLTMAVSSASPSLAQVAIVALVNLILCVGLYTFVGNTGVLSFGSISFATVGAYVAGILVMSPDLKALLLPALPKLLRAHQLNPYLALLIAGIVGGVVAGLIAVPLVRISGLVAGLASFALLLIVRTTANSWNSVTRGAKGLSAIPMTTTATRCLIFAALAIGVSFVLQRSRIGLQLRAAQDDEVAALAAGIPVALHRGIAFVISGIIMAVAGGLYGMTVGTVNPGLFYLNTTFLIFTMLVVGGMRNLTGALVGSVFVSVVAEMLRHAEQGSLLGVVIPTRAGVRDVGLAVILLIVLLWRPEGLTRGRELSLRLRGRGIRLAAWRPGRPEPIVSEPNISEPAAPRS
jgi:branched-chain amino acid transport system permease protein